MSTLLDKSNEILEEKQTKILPENIKQGVTAFGVTGTLTAVNNQNKTVTENGTYTADQGYTGLGEVTVNVDSIPDGIFIQENTPTKTTSEALWLKEEDMSEQPAFLDSLPDEILNLTFNGTSLRTLVSMLSVSQKDYINNAKVHIIKKTGNYATIIACDSAFFGGDGNVLRGANGYAYMYLYGTVSTTSYSSEGR